MADNEPDGLIAAFLADEEAAFATAAAGRFWTSNHHRIRPLAAKAPGLGDPSERVSFYFHFMRRSGEVPAVADRDLPLLVEAYRLLLPHIDRPGAAQMARRHALLFLFGFDDSGPLHDGETKDAKDLKVRLKTLAQTGKYTSLPAQRQKKASFASHAADAPRLLETLRHLGYRHDRRHGDDAYDIANLTFWGMVLIVLSHADTRAQLVVDMLDDGYDLPRRAGHLGILHKTVRAVLPDCAPGETGFFRAAERLAAIEAARREAGEAVALARRLGLAFAQDEDWTVQIAMAQHGSGRSALLAPNLVLTLRSDPDDNWHIGFAHSERGRFSEADGRIFQNDPGIAGLGSGNLARFPDWRRGLNDRDGLSFDIGTADIRAGRDRAVAKLLAGWLRG